MDERLFRTSGHRLHTRIRPASSCRPEVRARRLMEADECALNSMLEAIYHQSSQFRDEWKRKLPNMYLWIDYFSIPQPGAFSGPKEEEEAPVASQEHDTDHRLLFKEGEEVPLDQNADGEVSLAELVSPAAVESIPSY